MTVHDQLVALGADDREAQDAATLLARCFPLGRPIMLTDEVVAAIGVNAAGGAVMAATLSGPAYYPTAVYLTEDGNVHIAGPGTGPDDGYGGYYSVDVNAYGTPRTDWGRYSAAVADQDGSIWIASEFIPGVRTTWANWGTFIGHVQIHH